MEREKEEKQREQQKERVGEAKQLRNRWRAITGRPNNTRSNGIRTLTESQAASAKGSENWVPPEGALGRLTAAASARAAALASSARALEHAAARREPAPSLMVAASA